VRAPVFEWARAVQEGVRGHNHAETPLVLNNLASPRRICFRGVDLFSQTLCEGKSRAVVEPVFHPDASETRCEAALVLDVDPVGLVWGKGQAEGLLDQYVNDRP
jgi:hypothetical protein